MVKEVKVIQIENRAKVKAVKEEKKLVIMTDEDAFGWKKKRVPEIKEELKRLGLGAHGKKAELIARLEEHLSTKPSRAEPSNAEPNNKKAELVVCLEDHLSTKPSQAEPS